MKVEEVIEIVYELANQNKLTGQEADENEEEAERQQEALDVIHDFSAWINKEYPMEKERNGI